MLVMMDDGDDDTNVERARAGDGGKATISMRHAGDAAVAARPPTQRLRLLGVGARQPAARLPPARQRAAVGRRGPGGRLSVSVRASADRQRRHVRDLRRRVVARLVRV